MFTERTIQLFGKHSSLRTIENYLANSPTLRCPVPDVIDPNDFKHLFGDLVKHRTSESLELLVELTKLKNWYGRLTRIVEAKLVFYIEATVDVLNRDNYLILSMFARSLMEQAASIIYLNARRSEERRVGRECRSR